MLPLICLLQGLNKVLSDQKQPPEVFYKKGVLKNIAKFTGKHLCQSLFLIRLQAFMKKEALAQVFSCGFCKISKRTPFSQNISVRLLLSVPYTPIYRYHVPLRILFWLNNRDLFRVVKKRVNR